MIWCFSNLQIYALKFMILQRLVGQNPMILVNLDFIKMGLLPQNGTFWDHS